jgi:hypothetical protein
MKQAPSLARGGPPLVPRVEVVDALLPRALLAAHRVAPEGVAAVHHDVALFQVVKQVVELVVDQPTGG